MWLGGVLCLFGASTALGATPAERAAMLVQRMTATEKLALLQGVKGPYIGQTAAIPRLAIPAVRLEDGPQGVADWLTNVTNFPSSLTAASAWDVDLMQRYGATLANEQRLKGSNVMLGPGVCICRVPQGGRNFEYMSEDPFHGASLAHAEVLGIQSEHVVANAKHFADNSQEGPGHNGRLTTSSVVGARAQHELYYAPFQASDSASD
jgi:beta-glucosidase